MAKKTKKYRFQRNKKKTLAWVIGVVAVIAAIVIGVVVYNSTRTGEFTASVPSGEQLNNIAANLDVLTSHTDKFYAAPQEDGSTTLQFFGSEHADTVMLYVNHGIENYTDYLYANYMLPSIFTVDLSALTSGQIDMNDYQLNIRGLCPACNTKQTNKRCYNDKNNIKYACIDKEHCRVHSKDVRHKECCDSKS